MTCPERIIGKALEDQTRLDISFADSHTVNVFASHVRKSGAAEGGNGRADGRVGDALNAEDIGESRAHVLAEGAEDEQLVLLVEEENAGEHLDDGS